MLPWRKSLGAKVVTCKSWANVVAEVSLFFASKAHREIVDNTSVAPFSMLIAGPRAQRRLRCTYVIHRHDAGFQKKVPGRMARAFLFA